MKLNMNQINVCAFNSIAFLFISTMGFVFSQEILDNTSMHNSNNTQDDLNSTLSDDRIGPRSK